MTPARSSYGDARPVVIVISGATPYLGGPETWRPLREVAPDIAFVSIDPLDFVDAPDLDRAFYESVRPHLPSVAAVVTHFNADRAVVELIARECPDVPIVILSPCTMFSDHSRLRLMTTILGNTWIVRIIAAIASAKLHRLRTSRAFVAKQLASFVGACHLDDRLVDEAFARVLDVRTTRAVARTAELIRELLRPLGDEARDGASFTVVVGSSPMDRHTARRTTATVVPGVVAAAMIEAPATVAAIVRASIGRARSASDARAASHT